MSDVFPCETKMIHNTKRRIQIALRRYLMSGAEARRYRKHFGLEPQDFRVWMEIQFTPEMTWDNYAKAWDIDHRIPVCYFDVHSSEDVALAYHFTNIQPSLIRGNRNKAARLDVRAYMEYFLAIYDMTHIEEARLIFEKISTIPVSMREITVPQLSFLAKLPKQDFKEKVKSIISEIKKS